MGDDAISRGCPLSDGEEVVVRLAILVELSRLAHVDETKAGRVEEGFHLGLGLRVTRHGRGNFTQSRATCAIPRSVAASHCRRLKNITADCKEFLQTAPSCRRLGDIASDYL